MKLYNTLGRQLQDLKPIKPGEVSFYTCGPTVYDFQHIGNYSGYIYWDVLQRLLEYQGQKVERVMNITDVGHLVSDGDEGEDKLEKGAAREDKTARDIADFYSQDFINSMKALNLRMPKLAKASDYIPQQIEMIHLLIDNGFAYQTEQAIYFDVSKLSDYGKLTGQNLSDKEVGVRDEVVVDNAKKNPQDFALWFFTVARFANHEMHWASPWGEGFPGWHIECSAIVHSLLGDPIDIHAGGIDHIGTHHTNEIAQTEAAYSHPLANYWIHNNFMMVDGQKISKSLGNGYTLKDLSAKGYSPADFKVLVLQSHYRSQSNFTWESLEGAQNFYRQLAAWADQTKQDMEPLSSADEKRLAADVVEALGNDLNTPQALAVVSQFLGGASPSSELLELLDSLLGLELAGRPDISASQKELIQKREQARHNKDWALADKLRKELEDHGIGLRDAGQRSIWFRF